MQPGELRRFKEPTDPVVSTIKGQTFMVVEIVERGVICWGNRRVRFLMEDKVSEALDLHWVESNSEVLDGVE
jgi:hypothetical protein